MKIEKKEITIIEKKLFLYPRMAYDVFNWREFIVKNSPIKDQETAISVPLFMIRDSLKRNISILEKELSNYEWYELSKRRSLKKEIKEIKYIIEPDSLMKIFSEKDILEIVEMINVLEGNNQLYDDNEKKKLNT